MKHSEGETCPLCTHQFVDRTDVKIHLMVDHRKSEVTDELLRWVDSDTTLSRPLTP